MNISHKTLLGIAVFGVLAIAGVLFYSSSLRPAAMEPLFQASVTPSPTPSASPTPELPRISDIRITPPAGWYTHVMSDFEVMYTKQQQLPSLSGEGTDAFPYGEAIIVSVSNQEVSMEEWEEQHLINDVTTRSKAWTTWHGYKLLKTKHITPSADELTYYLFVNNRVYTFSLYPADGDPDLQTQEPRPNTKGITTLEQIMESYLPYLQ